MAQLPSNGALKRTPVNSPSKSCSVRKSKKVHESKMFYRRESSEFQGEQLSGCKSDQMTQSPTDQTDEGNQMLLRLESSSRTVLNKTESETSMMSEKSCQATGDQVTTEKKVRKRQKKKKSTASTPGSKSVDSAPDQPLNIPVSLPVAGANIAPINTQEGNKPSTQTPKEGSRKKKKKGSNAQEANAQQPGEEKFIAASLTTEQELIINHHQIQLLKKRSQKHPKALFLCKLCLYFCDCWAVVEHHIEQTRHKSAMEVRADQRMLKLLPEPLPGQIESYSKLIENTVKALGIPEELYCVRRNIAIRINGIVQEHLPDCSIQLYGSSATRMGLSDSDVNLNLVVLSSAISGPSAMTRVYQLMKDEPSTSEVEFNTADDIPRVLFTDLASKLKCNICLNNYNAYQISELLSKYETIDSRVQPLAVAFRIWANMCKLDKPDLGSLPPYAFYIMVVYYLQQLKNPVLPVLHELVEQNKQQGESDEKSHDVKSVEKTPEGKSDGKTHQEISDEKAQHAKTNEKSQQKKTEKNTKEKTEEKNQQENAEIYLDPSQLEGKWATSNTMTVGELWIDLLKFYLIDFNMHDIFVCIRSKKPVNRSAKKWTGKKLTIEDPFLPKRNVTRSIVHQSTSDYLMHCLQITFKYFRIPQTEQGPIFYKIEEAPMLLGPLIKYKDRHTNTWTALQQIMKVDPRFHSSEKCQVTTVTKLEKKLQGIELNELENPENEPDCLLKVPTFGSTLQSAIVTQDVALFMFNDFKPQYLAYKFQSYNFTVGKELPVVCSLCHELGHLKTNCPEEVFGPLEPLPPVPSAFLAVLSSVCEDICERWQLTESEYLERSEIVSDLEQYISKELYPDVSLKLFGSSCNGFGLHKSDLDVCLTFKENESGKDLNFSTLIEELHSALQKYPMFTNLIPITTAKVPILKFYHRHSKLEGDISFYNTLAQENTRLLNTYAEIDKRVKVLGYVMKRFAKLCDICDASRGSLSSYAYVLMVIYFLQQCNPPVLPVLQELTVSGKPIENNLDDCNTYFFDDIENLSKVWEHIGKNVSTVGELWIELLCFYTEKFNFKRDVISIRQKQQLLRFEKLWTSKCMAIEDPFDLSHNLGAGLSRKMHNFIIKAFRKGRIHFTNSRDISVNFPLLSLRDHFFNNENFTDGAPPNDRGCRICKKIGHLCRDCPIKKQNRRGERKQWVKQNGNGGASMEQDGRGRLVQNPGGKIRFGKQGKHIMGGNPRQIEYRNVERSGRFVTSTSVADDRLRAYTPDQMDRGGWINNAHYVQQRAGVYIPPFTSRLDTGRPKQRRQRCLPLSPMSREHLRPIINPLPHPESSPEIEVTEVTSR